MGSSADPALLARAVRNPGRLCFAPTNTTSGSYPWGGTALGFTRGGKMEIDVRYRENRDPASGAVTEIARKSVEFPRLVFVIEGPIWDEDALVALFSKTSTTTTYRPTDLFAQGTLTPSLVPAQVPILFAPDDPAGKAVYFKRPLFIFQFGESIPLSLKLKAGLPIVIVPTPTSSSGTGWWQIARLENLVL